MKTKKTGQTGKLRSGSEWIYGLNPVLEAIKAGRNIKNIYISSNRHHKVFELKKESEFRNIPLKISDPIFFNYTFNKGHQGVAAEVSSKDYVSLDELLNIPLRKKEISLFLILDCIEDPRNFGAILRVADAAGIHGVVIQSHRSVQLGSVVSKVSAGAVEYVPVCMVSNIKYAISEMKKSGITVVGTEASSGKTIWDLNLKMPLALVIGSEGKGIRKTVGKSCDVLVSLPMLGKLNSLNVSVATGIFAFEILRQRLCNN
ncbi:MAG: 23S rRNA (guanosine(2251)-2'-O)-methyltransferase RlmB [Nitrospirae bacterium RBG_13_39_12]|nr:MAG: 23S rRNA (guanosine(2251)-2'-O)-methyltransferase RlmB [Nitrospirae bacterium RBG_13_39_12]